MQTSNLSKYNRRRFVSTLGLGITALGCAPYILRDRDKAEQFIPLSYNKVRLQGELGRRMEITIVNNLLKIDIENDFLLPFERRQGDGAGYIGLGKLIDAVVTFAACTENPEVIQLKEHIIAHVREHQEPDGYYGLFPSEQRITKLWDIHEIQYIAWGLLRDFELTGDGSSLATAQKIADYIIANWNRLPENWGKDDVAPHVAVTGLERTMIALYRITGEKKYLDFVISVRKLAEWDLPIIIGRRVGIEGHMYAYLARTLAQIELYNITREQNLLTCSNRVTAFMLKKDGLMLTGNGGQWEIWTDDQDGRGALGETCATAYQLRLYHQLMQIEGNPLWGDLMERTIYNALFASQSPDGRQLRYFAPTEGPRAYHNTDTYCCPNNYRRIVAELPAFVYYTSENGVVVNLYVESQAEIQLPGGHLLKIEQQTNYPSSGYVNIVVNPVLPLQFKLKLRVPAWAHNAIISINGQSLTEPIVHGEFLTINREWVPGDKVSLEIKMPFRLIAGRKRQSGRVAVARGPLVYCLNPQQNEKLKHLDGIELSRIIIDPETMTLINDNTVRPGGTACRVKAWMASFGMAKPPHEYELNLTEFPDPEGIQTYFSLSDMNKAMSDELFANT